MAGGVVVGKVKPRRILIVGGRVMAALLVLMAIPALLHEIRTTDPYRIRTDGSLAAEVVTPRGRRDPLLWSELNRRLRVNALSRSTVGRIVQNELSLGEPTSAASISAEFVRQAVESRRCPAELMLPYVRLILDQDPPVQQAPTFLYSPELINQLAKDILAQPEGKWNARHANLVLKAYREGLASVDKVEPFVRAQLSRAIELNYRPRVVLGKRWPATLHLQWEYFAGLPVTASLLSVEVNSWHCPAQAKTEANGDGGGSITGGTMEVPADAPLAPGRQTAKFTAELLLNLNNPKSQPISHVWTIERPITVLPPGSPVLEPVTDPTLIAKVESGIRVFLRREKDGNVQPVISVCKLPVSLCGWLCAVTPQGRIRLVRLTEAAGVTNVSEGGSGNTLKGFGHVPLVYEPDLEAGEWFTDADAFWAKPIDLGEVEPEADPWPKILKHQQGLK